MNVRRQLHALREFLAERKGIEPARHARKRPGRVHRGGDRSAQINRPYVPVGECHLGGKIELSLAICPDTAAGNCHLSGAAGIGHCHFTREMYPIEHQLQRQLQQAENSREYPGSGLTGGSWNG